MVVKLLKKKSEGNSHLLQFILPGNCLVEAAVIEHWQEIHICLPTMAGCPIFCRHCATTYSADPFVRKLTSGELQAMSRYLIDMAGFCRLPVILSFSGHGEPLLNWAAIRKCMQEIGTAADKIYVTTIGITPILKGILESGETDVTFFLSLHGSTDAERQKLIPRGRNRSDVDTLFSFADTYLAAGGQVVFNYMLTCDNSSETALTRVASRLKAFDRSGTLRLTDYTDIGFDTGVRPLCGQGSEIQRNWLMKLSMACPDWDIRFSKLSGQALGVACGQMRAGILGNENTIGD